MWKLAEVSRRKSLDRLRGCVRHADLLREHAGAAFLLIRGECIRAVVADARSASEGRRMTDLPLWIGGAIGVVIIAMLLTRRAVRRRRHHAAE